MNNFNDYYSAEHRILPVQIMIRKKCKQQDNVLEKYKCQTRRGHISSQNIGAFKKKKNSWNNNYYNMSRSSV